MFVPRSFRPAGLRAMSILTVGAVLLAPGAGAQTPEPIRFARTPAVATDGRIAFAYQDDIWTADANGANPRRLTLNLARDFAPRFSPDGKWIAFTSNRTGNDDVFVMPSTGGETRQLTWYPGPDQVQNWMPDGQSLIISSNRGWNAFGSPLYRLPLDGQPATALPTGYAATGSMKPDLSMLAYNKRLPSAWRKGFRGNATADIAVVDVKSGEISDVTDTNPAQYRTYVNDVFPMWGADGLIYYSSERDGTYNLWRMSAKGASPQQVTRYKDNGVFFPSMSPDGKRIIYQRDFDLYTLDVPDGTPKKVSIPLSFDAKVNDVELLTTNARAEAFSVSPGGDYLAVDFHGEIMIVPAESGFGEKTQVTASSWRDRNEVYSPDGKKVAYVSDETGDEEVWVFDLATGVRKQLSKQESEKADITWAPNSQKLAYAAANRVFEVDLTGGAARELAHNPAGGFSLSEYSRDGSWLVYTRRDDDQNADTYLYDIRARKEYDVTQSPGTDGEGLLTPDGKTLVFVSNRDGAQNQLFTVSLARLTEDPDDPLVRERVRRAAQAAGGGRGGRGGAAPDSGSGPTHIDLEGIEKRAMQLTRGPVGVSGFFLSNDGRTVYFAVGGGFGGRGGGGRGGAPANSAAAGLFSIGIDGRDQRRIAAGTFAGMQPTADRRAIFFRAPARAAASTEPGTPAPAGFEIERLAIPGGAGGGGGGGRAAGAGTGGATTQSGERVNFSFQVRVDRREEWKEMFGEVWRAMKYRYYDASMNNHDWAAIRARYEPLLRFVGTNEDLYDLGNAMIGEINSSHTGVSGPPTHVVPDMYRSRFLGFELEPAGGRYRIAHIYRDGPADKEWLGLAVGDYVLAIDGQDVKAGDNYWKILANTANEYVPVKVARAADGANARTARIASVESLNNIKYEEWVADNRDEVEKATNGEIAYVHIRAMNQPSLARFENEIDRFWNKKGIIVDIRNNGGGNIDQELLDILERRPYEFWNNRNGARTWGRRPRQAIAGPKVMLVNARSASDAEVTPMGFRELGLGRIVGNPTSAQVIATGSYALINGGAVRTPGSLVVTWDPSKPNNYGVNLEGYGVPPDVWVKNSPTDEVKGVDRELKAAIDEALKMLKEGPGKRVTNQ